MSRIATAGIGIAIAVLGAVAWSLAPRDAQVATWTDAEIDTLKSLRIAALGPVPVDPTNAVADDPEAASLGYRLFFDTRLSGNGAVACATCHQPERRFTDGLPKALGMGTAKRNAPSIVGSAYSPWLYWDGRRDSLWAQALTPLEDGNEHGTERHHVVAIVAGDPDYSAAYRSVFGKPPDASSPEALDESFANVGKAIAAYERLIVPGPSRFDAYVEAVLAGDVRRQGELFSDEEIAGLKLFIGKAECTQCHNGPLLANNDFHNTGTVSFPGDTPDKGRAAGIPQLQADPFNCLGEFSDDPERDCSELEFMLSSAHLLGAMRTPSLRNLAGTEPYMHKGQLETLREVLEHYNVAPPAMIGHSDVNPLELGDRELRRLEAFLNTLDAPPATPARWLARPTS